MNIAEIFSCAGTILLEQFKQYSEHKNNTNNDKTIQNNTAFL